MWAPVSLKQTFPMSPSAGESSQLPRSPVRFTPANIPPAPHLFPPVSFPPSSLPKRGSADSYILGRFGGFLAMSKSLAGLWPSPDGQGHGDSLPWHPALAHKHVTNIYKLEGGFSLTRKTIIQQNKAKDFCPSLYFPPKANISACCPSSFYFILFISLITLRFVILCFINNTYITKIIH